MDLTILRKKISSFKGQDGRLFKISDELIMEILSAWEQWVGPAGTFYSEIGVSAKKMARILGRAKKLKREGISTDGFQEIALAVEAQRKPNSEAQSIELILDENKIIRFPHADLLIDFLKKIA